MILLGWQFDGKIELRLGAIGFDWEFPYPGCVSRLQGWPRKSPCKALTANNNYALAA